MAEQLTFELPARTSHSRGDFFVSQANRLAVLRLDDPGRWPAARLALVGAEGAGKTHLAHVWAEANNASMLDARSLLALDIAAISGPVALEAGDGALDAGEEEAIFHLLNHMAGAHLPLLITTRLAPARWPVALADLKSRAQATEVAQIDGPDDALLAAVLVKLFADRQLQVAPGLVVWLTQRMERSFAEAQRLVAVLDAAALTKGCAITLRFAQSVLDKGAGRAR